MARGQLQCAFGANLRRERLARGLSQEALAEELHCHRTYLGGLERGDRNPSLQTVERIAEQLKLSPLRLLSESAQ